MKPLKEKISITIDNDILEKIRTAAEEDDRSLSQYINIVLKEHIKKQLKWYQLLFLLLTALKIYDTIFVSHKFNIYTLQVCIFILILVKVHALLLHTCYGVFEFVWQQTELCIFRCVRLRLAHFFVFMKCPTSVLLPHHTEEHPEV